MTRLIRWGIALTVTCWVFAEYVCSEGASDEVGHP